MTKAEAGRLGGLANAKKHGREHFRKIGSKGGKTHTPEHMKTIGRLGGLAFHAKYKLKPIGVNDFAIINRETGRPLDKTLGGLDLSAYSGD